MAGYYKITDLKQQLELENIFDLFVELGGEPEYCETGIISSTICHNLPTEGSRKLYYYTNTQLCRCYTGCDESFDIFELVIKAMKIQKNYDWELYDAMNWVASFFGLIESEKPTDEIKIIEDWDIIKRHEYSEIKINTIPQIKPLDKTILNLFSYPRILSWEKEGILPNISRACFIGYYPVTEQIVIPHFDINNNLIGIRGRFLAEDDVMRYGKYKPLIIHKVQYNHPLSMNLYNLNNSKENIKRTRSAIIFESEKGCLQFRSIYGENRDISVACCGSSISTYQIELLEHLGVEQLVIAFDRDFIEIGDSEFIRLKKKLINLYNKYNNRIRVNAIFDKNFLTGYKDSPIDCGKEIFEQLLKERIIPKE